MSYFDDFVNVSYKKDALGRILFFPWGILGKGYIVESEQTHQKLKNSFKKMYLIMIPIVITMVIIQPIIAIYLGLYTVFFFLMLFASCCVWIYFSVKKITDPLPVSSEKLKISESFSSSAKPHSIVTLILLELFSIGFIGIGIYNFIWCHNQFIGFVTIVFFLFCSISIAYWIIKKLRPTGRIK